MLVHKCDNCKKEIKGRDKEIIRRIRLASVLILRTLRKANHHVPEETQASSACRDDWVIAQSRFLQQETATDAVSFFFYGLL